MQEICIILLRKPCQEQEFKKFNYPFGAIAKGNKYVFEKHKIYAIKFKYLSYRSRFGLDML